MDWCFVTAKTVYLYIPFEQSNVNQREAFKHIAEQLAKHPPPIDKHMDDEDSTPLWYVSKSKLRKAIYIVALHRIDTIRQN